MRASRRLEVARAGHKKAEHNIEALEKLVAEAKEAQAKAEEALVEGKEKRDKAKLAEEEALSECERCPTKADVAPPPAQQQGPALDITQEGFGDLAGEAGGPGGSRQSSSSGRSSEDGIGGGKYIGNPTGQR